MAKRRPKKDPPLQLRNTETSSFRKTIDAQDERRKAADLAKKPRKRKK